MSKKEIITINSTIESKKFANELLSHLPDHVATDPLVNLAERLFLEDICVREFVRGFVISLPRDAEVGPLSDLVNEVYKNHKGMCKVVKRRRRSAWQEFLLEQKELGRLEGMDAKEGLCCCKEMYEELYPTKEARAIYLESRRED